MLLPRGPCPQPHCLSNCLQRIISLLKLVYLELDLSLSVAIFLDYCLCMEQVFWSLSDAHFVRKGIYLLLGFIFSRKIVVDLDFHWADECFWDWNKPSHPLYSLWIIVFTGYILTSIESVVEFLYRSPLLVVGPLTIYVELGNQNSFQKILIHLTLYIYLEGLEQFFGHVIRK